MTLTLKISDPSGVDADSVKATINPSDFEISDWTQMGDTFSARFDTRDAMFTDLVALTINIDAKDKASNPATASLVLRLDNVPPVVSIDPPMIREWFDTPNAKICSEPFDPLGAATSDLDIVGESSVYRALVFDQTNRAPGDVVHYHAGVNNSSVQLFAQGDPEIPLLVDTNGDGVCDEISRDQPASADRPKLLQAAP